MGHVDVISDILKKAMEAFPESNFLQSLAHQYLVRGWLSKKQMEGLYDKAAKSKEMPAGKLATLKAQIQKMPTRYKSEKPEIKEVAEDDQSQQWIKAILEKYPQHKRVLFLQAKTGSKTDLTATEKTELQKLYQLLMAKK
jgi:3-hydroxyacyl-CoA dehydrogenase